MTANVLTVQSLSKFYQDFPALVDFNLEIQAGEIVGLAGPNGAGKTTFFKILTGLITQYTGHLSLLGSESPNHYRKNQGLMGTIIEAPAFMPQLSAQDNLAYFALQRGVSEPQRIQEVLDLVHLTPEEARRPYRAFSLGMKQRLAIASALLHYPSFLVLDEPTNGLDPEGIVQIRQLLRYLAKEKGLTILLSSHILSELEHLADRFVLINHGHKIAEFTQEELMKEARGYLEIVTEDPAYATTVLSDHLHIQDFEVHEDGSIRLYEFDQSPPDLIQALVTHQVPLYSVTPQTDNLESFYLKTLKGGL